MRAVRFHCVHDVRVENVRGPDGHGREPDDRQAAVVRICGTDLHEYLGGPIVVPTEPHALTGAKAPQVAWP